MHSMISFWLCQSFNSLNQRTRGKYNPNEIVDNPKENLPVLLFFRQPRLEKIILPGDIDALLL